MASQFHSLALDDRLLDRCARAGLAHDFTPENAREAQVFRLAALALATSFPIQSARLLEACQRYFGQHPGQERDAITELAAQEVINLAQLRFKLEKLFSRELDSPYVSETERVVTPAWPR
ncbi:hypothetical protein [Chitinimonas naiadis]